MAGTCGDNGMECRNRRKDRVILRMNEKGLLMSPIVVNSYLIISHV